MIRIFGAVIICRKQSGPTHGLLPKCAGPAPLRRTHYAACNCILNAAACRVVSNIRVDVDVIDTKAPDMLPSAVVPVTNEQTDKPIISITA